MAGFRIPNSRALSKSPNRNPQSEIVRRLGDEWLPAIYRDRIRTQRTRAHRIEVPPRENRADIMHTLLGIELKVGKRRFACPDLATARYLQVFARIGIGEFAVPYDITKISAIADDLEIARHKTLLLVDELSASEHDASPLRLRNSVLREIRREIAEIGPGPAIPEFRQSTRQR